MSRRRKRKRCSSRPTPPKQPLRPASAKATAGLHSLGEGGRLRRPGRPSKKRLDSVRAALKRPRRPGLADGPPVLRLKELVREFGDPGGALARLVARDPDTTVIDEARMMLFLAAQEPSVPGEARDRIGSSATPVLLDAMRDAAVPDERKYHIGPLLEVFGVEFCAGEYRSFFRDLDRAAEKMNREMMRRLPERKLRESMRENGTEPFSPARAHLVLCDVPAAGGMK